MRSSHISHISHITPITYHTDSDVYFHCLHYLPGCVWLDSGAPRSYNARYDILSALPREQIISDGPGSTCIHFRSGESEHCLQNALACLDHRLSILRQSYTASTHDRDQNVNEDGDAIPFTGGAIGYVSYEALHQLFKLSSDKTQEPALPDVSFGLYDWALIQDHLEQVSYLYFLPDCPEEIIAQLTTRIAEEKTPSEFIELNAYSCSPLQADISAESYRANVEKVQAYIQAGDCYQVNFTQRFSGNFTGSTAAAYLHLRRALTGPFSAYMNTPSGDILSLSPERFVELDGGRIMTQPIKGTAPRGESPEDDQALAEELQASTKNRAENVMIVDLLRNDFSKICEPYSVKVPELFSLQSFTNVHHLVSRVTGRLQHGQGWRDVLLASFPGGSITGAPKKRAMEIIDELEDSKRSVYCGSIMYLSLNGRMDSSIAIRTLVQADGKIYCWGGGGIVADSDPELEYQESLHKISLLLDTLCTD